MTRHSGMWPRTRLVKRTSRIIDPSDFGVSFSLKQCSSFDIDPEETLRWLVAQGFRRFRLMSYWNEHEKEPKKYDFSALDWQIDMANQPIKL